MSLLEIDDLVETYKQRSMAEIPGYRYYHHAVEILALRKLGVKHRLIAELLNRKVKADRPLTNNHLSVLLSKWKASNLLNGLETEIQSTVLAIKQQAEADQIHAPADIEDAFGFIDKIEKHNVVEFMKSVEKRLLHPLSENEKEHVKAHFKNADKASDFGVEVNKCLTALTGMKA